MVTLFCTIILLALSHDSRGFLVDQKCEDVDTTACLALQSKQPEICFENSVLAQTTCMKTCGNCRRQCYNCRTPVLDPQDCNTTTLCGTSMMCLTKQLHSTTNNLDEYVMQCEDREVCRGYDITFKKRANTVDRSGRSATFQCCDTDFCNKPKRNKTRGCLKDVVFLLDESGSQGNANFQQVLAFVKTLLSRMDIGDQFFRVAMVTFSTTPSLQWYLDTYKNKQSMLDAINKIPYSGGSTHTADALRFVEGLVLTYDHGDRPIVPNVVIVITDGQSTDHVATIREASYMQRNGTEMISVGIGKSSSLQQDELALIASDSRHAFEVNDFTHLFSIENEILDLLCNQS